MFQHLDDPVPFQPDDDFFRAVMTGGRRRRRHRRLVTTMAALTALVTAVAAGGVLYVERRDAAIDRADVITQPSTDGALNILVVGSDRHPGGQGPEVEDQRADTLAVARLAPDGTLDVLAIPRDLVDPATGERISAYAQPQDLVDAVTAVLGIPVDHYVELDFEGFVGLVDDLGGLPVAVDAPLVDPASGLDLQPSECTTLDGETALALVRSRRAGGDQRGDLGRMARTQSLLAIAVARLAAEGDDPQTLDRMTRVFADHGVVDDALTLETMLDVGRRLAAAGADGVETLTLPVAERQGQGGTAALLELAAEATTVLRRFGSDGTSVPPAAPPASPVLASLDDPTGLRPC